MPSATLEPPALGRPIYPVGAYALSGLALHQGRLLSLDTVQGYLLQIAPVTGDTSILNSRQVSEFQGATGLAVWGERLWLAQDNHILTGDLADLTLKSIVQLPYAADDVAVWEQTLYVACHKAGRIFVYDADSGERITQFRLPGIGTAKISVVGDYLWVCDQLEQTVYCLDRATEAVLVNVLTPFASPTGIWAPPEATPAAGTVWLTYALEEPYIRDNPNQPEFPFELTFRDRTFLHSLHFTRQDAIALSTGYKIEMIYAEELEPLDDVTLTNARWRMAFPANTPRQKCLSVEPVGRPFKTVQENGQNVAEFTFDSLHPNERHLFGWRAVLEVRGIKHQLTPSQVEDAPSLSSEFQAKYLVDDDELSMDHPAIQAAAKEAVGRETNLLRKILSIRNYVYDRLSYGIRPAIDTPDVVIERGIGSCGEYVGLLLALYRLNGIACRTVGRYKCPPKADQMGIPLEPEFNHVWIEFYIPGYGWLPMESNVDDVQEGGPYPTRFFMGLPWYHIEMAKEVSFGKLHLPEGAPEVKIGDLALNHVRFRILEELA
ncbi:MAG: transglutaminase domain-containing protein [Cyanobacteria bacterium P01_D01_bin.14]